MRQQFGFTMIEVMLFLAISSSLAVLLLAGTGTAIQRQQYRDTVQSFGGFLKDQYEGVVSVRNDRANDQRCPIITSGPTVARGRSDCVILGKYVTTEEGGEPQGRVYSTFPVYGLQNSTGWQYVLGEQEDEYSINWGAKTKLSGQPEEGAVVSILLYRNPDSGSLAIRANSSRYTSDTIGYFFAGKTADGEDDPQQAIRQEICVYDVGWFTNQRQSIFLDARASSGDAISINNSSEACQSA